MITQIPGSHWVWTGNYKTGAALYAECVNVVDKLGHDPVDFCGKAAPTVKRGSYAKVTAGWLLDQTRTDGVLHYVYLNAYACVDDAKVRYDRAVRRCVTR